MSRPGLTPRAAQLLNVIEESIRKTGHSPNYDTLAKAMGVKGKGQIAALVRQLKERGAIKTLPGRAHSITLIEPAALPPDLENRVNAYCRNVGITRPVFDQRAAESLLRGRA